MDIADSLIHENKICKNQFNMVPALHVVEFTKLISVDWNFSRFFKVIINPYIQYCTYSTSTQYTYLLTTELTSCDIIKY